MMYFESSYIVYLLFFTDVLVFVLFLDVAYSSFENIYYNMFPYPIVSRARDLVNQENSFKE